MNKNIQYISAELIHSMVKNNYDFMSTNKPEKH